MARELLPYQIAERSIIKKYRKQLWNPFIAAVKRYALVEPGDKIAVCISGGKDSMLMAKLFQELHRHSDLRGHLPRDGSGLQRDEPREDREQRKTFEYPDYGV